MGETDRQQVVLSAWLSRQAAARDRIEAGVLARVRRLISRMDASAWYDDSAVRKLAHALAVVVRGGQSATAGSTSAYLQAVLRAQGAGLDRPVTPWLPEDGLRPGVSLVEEMERVAATYRWARSKDLPEPVATQRATDRALLIVDSDLGMAMQEASRQVLTRAPARVTGFRRVIHPELSRGGTCGLCAAAASRTYSREDLLPLHTHCRCEVAPITRGNDPGGALNDQALAELYRTAGSTSATDLSKVRVVVRQHGELGPVLTDERHEFRGPAKAASSARMPASAADIKLDPLYQIARAEERLVDLRARQAKGEDVSGPIAWNEGFIKKMQARAAAEAA